MGRLWYESKKLLEKIQEFYFNHGFKKAVMNDFKHMFFLFWRIIFHNWLINYNVIVSTGKSMRGMEGI